MRPHCQHTRPPPPVYLSLCPTRVGTCTALLGDCQLASECMMQVSRLSRFEIIPFSTSHYPGPSLNVLGALLSTQARYTLNLVPGKPQVSVALLQPHANWWHAASLLRPRSQQPVALPAMYACVSSVGLLLQLHGIWRQLCCFVPYPVSILSVAAAHAYN
jgi:hypothetical protein